jgi:hypothetical protein
MATPEQLNMSAPSQWKDMMTRAPYCRIFEHFNNVCVQLEAWEPLNRGQLCRSRARAMGQPKKISLAGCFIVLILHQVGSQSQIHFVAPFAPPSSSLFITFCIHTWFDTVHTDTQCCLDDMMLSNLFIDISQ